MASAELPFDDQRNLVGVDVITRDSVKLEPGQEDEVISKDYTSYPGSVSSSSLATDPTRSVSAPTPSPEFALQHFYDALDLIPSVEKEAYELAKMKCKGKVMESESGPRVFLRACDNNPWEAARRMVDYWAERVAIFGDRAFLPLMLGGEGALSKEDEEILDTGCVQLLPVDKSGRSVVFLDRSRLKPEMCYNTSGRLRVFFYVLHKAVHTSDNESCHRIVILALAVKPPQMGYDFEFPRRCLRLPGCMPMKIDEIHMLTLPSASGTGRLMQMVVRTAVSMLQYFGQLVTIHHGSTSSTEDSDGETEENGGVPDFTCRDNLVRQLRRHGLVKKGLPEAIGGTFRRSNFEHWCKRQLRDEQATFWTKEQLTQRRRSVNNVHSKQKRLRRRQEFESLKNSVDSLRCENKRARIEEQRLVSLLKKAKQLIATQPTTRDNENLNVAGTESSTVDFFDSESGVHFSEKPPGSSFALPVSDDIFFDPNSGSTMWNRQHETATGDSIQSKVNSPSPLNPFTQDYTFPAEMENDSSLSLPVDIPEPDPIGPDGVIVAEVNVFSEINGISRDVDGVNSSDIGGPGVHLSSNMSPQVGVIASSTTRSHSSVLPPVNQLNHQSWNLRNSGPTSRATNPGPELLAINPQGSTMHLHSQMAPLPSQNDAFSHSEANPSGMVSVSERSVAPSLTPGASTRSSFFGLFQNHYTAGSHATESEMGSCEMTRKSSTATQLSSTHNDSLSLSLRQISNYRPDHTLESVPFPETSYQGSCDTAPTSADFGGINPTQADPPATGTFWSNWNIF